jgi:hypothetical protein
MFLLIRARSGTALAFASSSSVLRGDQLALDFDRGAERHQELWRFRLDRAPQLGDVLLRQIVPPQHLRATRQPADRVEVLSIDAGRPLVLVDRRDAARQVAGRELITDQPDEIARLRTLRGDSQGEECQQQLPGHDCLLGSRARG